MINSYFQMINVDTPRVGLEWLSFSNSERIKRLTAVIDSAGLHDKIEIKSCNKNGHVYVEFIEPVETRFRSNVLLDLEMDFKQKIDNGITVWNQPLGDKSSLRRLRGVVIKS